MILQFSGILKGRVGGVTTTARPTIFPTFPPFETLPTLQPFTPPQGPIIIRQPGVSNSNDEESGSFLKKLGGIFDPKPSTTEINTGGRSFDRFVVRENAAANDPLSAIGLGGKWNERGTAYIPAFLFLSSCREPIIFQGCSGITEIYVLLTRRVRTFSVESSRCTTSLLTSQSIDG